MLFRSTQKLFLNGILTRFYTVLRESFDSRFVFGLNYAFNLSSELKVFPTGNILFDILRLDGIFGFIFFVAFLVFATTTLIRYWKKSEHEQTIKFMLIAFLTTLFVRFMFFYPYNIYVFENDFWQIDHFPLIESAYFAIFAFIVGYAHIDQKKKITNAMEVSNDEQ